MELGLDLSLSEIQTMSKDSFKARVKTSEGRESRSRLGLETEGTETLGLVSVSYKILELVSSRSRLG